MRLQSQYIRLIQWGLVATVLTLGQVYAQVITNIPGVTAQMLQQAVAVFSPYTQAYYTLSWSPVAWASYYEVSIIKLSDGSKQVKTVSNTDPNPTFAPLTGISNLTPTSIYQIGLAWSSEYTWQVKACNYLGCGIDSAVKVLSTPTVPIDGICGTSNRATLSAEPSGNLCKSGTTSTVVEDGTWKWACIGSSTGKTSMCAAASTVGCTLIPIVFGQVNQVVFDDKCRATVDTRDNNANDYNQFLIFTLAQRSLVSIPVTSFIAKNQNFPIEWLRIGELYQGETFSSTDSAPITGDFASTRVYGLWSIERDYVLNPGSYVYKMTSAIRNANSSTTPHVGYQATLTLLPTVTPLDGLTDTDTDGIPDSVETELGLNPSLKDNKLLGGMVSNSNKLFAMQQYRDFLAREGDHLGVLDWTARLTNNTSNRAQVVRGFFDSAEFQNKFQPLVRLYLSYYGRNPDFAGLTNWVNQRANGMSLETISQQFAIATEFTNTYGSLSNAQFVTLCYQNVLGRAPDTAGYNSWLAQLNSNAMTRGQVMLSFSESPEFKATSYNNVAVNMAYIGLLRRSPDGNSIGWLNQLNNGTSLTTILDGFIGSQEYRNRFIQ